MISINNNSKSLVIVIHEIYGINKHMKNICNRLAEKKFDVICPNLIMREEPYDSLEEQAAYQNFMENIGFDLARDKIKQFITENKDKYKKIFIIGYSIGATIAWLCSEEDGVGAIVGYYGSRIRNYTTINPLSPVLLFFPEQESSFDVDELMGVIEEKKVSVHKLCGQHGFTDSFSTKFNEKSDEWAFKNMMDFLGSC